MINFQVVLRKYTTQFQNRFTDLHYHNQFPIIRQKVKIRRKASNEIFRALKKGEFFFYLA